MITHPSLLGPLRNIRPLSSNVKIGLPTITWAKGALQLRLSGYLENDGSCIKSVWNTVTPQDPLKLEWYYNSWLKLCEMGVRKHMSANNSFPHGFTQSSLYDHLNTIQTDALPAFGYRYMELTPQMISDAQTLRIAVKQQLNQGPVVLNCTGLYKKSPHDSRAHHRLIVATTTEISKFQDKHDIRLPGYIMLNPRAGNDPTVPYLSPTEHPTTSNFTTFRPSHSLIREVQLYYEFLSNTLGVTKEDCKTHQLQWPSPLMIPI